MKNKRGSGSKENVGRTHNIYTSKRLDKMLPEDISDKCASIVDAELLKYKNSIEKIEAFIKKAKASEYVEEFVFYNPQNTLYDYYYHCVGVFNKNYFSVTFKSYQEKEEVICSVAKKNEEEFKKYFGL